MTLLQGKGLLQKMVAMPFVKKPLPGQIETSFNGEDDAPLFPTPSFYAPLKTTLVPAFSSGSGTPTFTRATVAYQTDFEGKLNEVLSGEARFQGARRVYNKYATSSEDFSVAGWTKTGVTITGTAGSQRAVWAAGGSKYLYQGAAVSVVGNVYRIRWTIRSNTGGTQLFRLFGDNTASESSNLTATTTDQIFSLLWTATGTNGSAGVEAAVGDSAADLIISNAQWEDVTGQTNQNPSEYVSVGVLSAPFHGAGVDGVKYFDTLNGNTVASNVVTEATGAPINSSAAAAAGGVTAGVVDAYGPLGYLAEGARTNLILQSRTLDNASWAVGATGADMEAVVANAYVSLDGTTTMDKLQTKATNAQHFLNQSVAGRSASVRTVSGVLRYVNHRWAIVRINDGATLFAASFDLLNGVAGAVSANVTSTISATALSNVYRVTVTTTVATATGGGTLIGFNNSDSATVQTWLAAGTEIIGATDFQEEEASFASSLITTTTVAVTRNADALEYPAAGNISDTAGSTYAEFAASSWADTVNAGIIADNGASAYLIAQSNPSVRIYDGTTLVNGPAVAGSGLVKGASTWSGASMQVFANGVAGTAGVYDGSFGASGSIVIGNRSGGQFSGTIREVVIWQQPLRSQLLIIKTRTL